MFYDEVEDVISAAEYLRTQPYIDQRRLYVAGASTGGTLTMLAAFGVTLIFALPPRSPGLPMLLGTRGTL